MDMQTKKQIVKKYMNANAGVMRLAPSWVTRTFLPPGRRLKLDNRDIYPRGASWGAVCERWMASTGKCDNGSTTGPFEGMSFIACKTENGIEKILLKEAIDLLGDEILGSEVMCTKGGLTSFAKFYDFSVPIHNHVHLMAKEAAKVGAPPKPEAYYFPIELNTFDYNASYTFFGIDPHLTKADVKKYLENWESGDNNILEISRAYKLKMGTGWDIPAGILHAPGSVVTYEPQYMSDTSLFMQTVNRDRYTERELLVKFVPEDKKYDLDYIVDCLDWEANTDLDFKYNHYHEPIPVADVDEMAAKGYYEEWIVYGSDEFCAKRLVVHPGQSVTITDGAAYGFISMQGYGKINDLPLETPACIRYEQLTCDEYFVTKSAAEKGVTITNLSDNADIVMLKHFGPGNKEADKFLKKATCR